MDLLTSIFNTLMRMTPHKTDTETRAERVARMHIVATSINDATKRAACYGLPVAQCRPIFSDRRTLAALLIAKGRFESGFAQYVHEGRCDEGPVGARCDADKNGVARAHGLWQQWRPSIFPASDWDDMQAATPEATNLAAWHAAKLLAGSRSMCKAAFGGDEMQAAIAGFSGSCTLGMAPQKIAKQAALARKILETLPAE